ncbi:SH3 domain-containing protein [Klebsormidium nitens]|uniref:SH3 domain-containing protein n=1 Tax=Klebsormidium nitens TaxID=105231 RepID=A0A1Y1HN28_KLENI|nr:SH3 domain-containing protein [Klebsormidium nitens]|eukprot:GAQ80034.1 SH3 domain-containing protein [Klebsormidium nitens]
MDFLRKHAQKLGSEVSKQQAAVMGKFAAPKEGSNAVVTDEAELQRHQQLERLNASTTNTKHFQKDIVKGVDGLVASGAKYSEIGARLGDDCRKYAVEGPAPNSTLARAALHYSNGRVNVEKERESFHRALATTVGDPLKAMISGAPLEDARHLYRRYEKLRDEAVQTAGSVQRRSDRASAGGSADDASKKLREAEQKMQDLTAAMAVLGKEAASSLISVETQQQRVTLQRLIDAVRSEKEYHATCASLLDQVYSQIMAERQKGDSAPPTPSGDAEASFHGDSSGGAGKPSGSQKALYFLAEAMHAFQAESDSELSLQIGDFVVVRQVSDSGWSEGECKGRAGWFPTAYVEQRQRVPINKVVESGQNVAVHNA